MLKLGLFLNCTIHIYIDLIILIMLKLSTDAQHGLLDHCGYITIC